MKSAALKCLASPWSVVAILFWILNDLYFKTNFPGWWTGKLSDLTSLFVVPYLIAYFFTVLSGGRGERIFFLTGLVGIGVLFTGINLSQELNDFYTYFFWGPNAIRGRADPTDLVTLVVFVPCFFFFRSCQNKPETNRLGGCLALLLCSFAMLNTSFTLDSNQVEGDLDRVVLFLLSGSQANRLYLDEPRDGMSVAAGQQLVFRWHFSGYVSDDPAQMLPNVALCSSGIFQGYRLQIASSDIFDDVVLSADTDQTEAELTMDLPPLEYSWRTALVYELNERCDQAERLLFLGQEWRTLVVE